MTGSAATHDQLLWGPPGPDHDRRRRGELPTLIGVPISAELGNITPIAIVPDSYRLEELAFQARSIATMVTNNASFNCASAKMLVTANGWKQRGAFLDLLMRFLSDTPTATVLSGGRRTVTVGSPRAAICELWATRAPVSCRGVSFLVWTLLPPTTRCFISNRSAVWCPRSRSAVLIQRSSCTRPPAS